MLGAGGNPNIIMCHPLHMQHAHTFTIKFELRLYKANNDTTATNSATDHASATSVPSF